jgi:hypothetical protein
MEVEEWRNGGWKEMERGLREGRDEMRMLA